MRVLLNILMAMQFAWSNGRRRRRAVLQHQMSVSGLYSREMDAFSKPWLHRRKVRSV